jgi:hypothetical protein
VVRTGRALSCPANWTAYARFPLRCYSTPVPASRRWGDPYAKLLQGAAWDRVRARVCRTLGRSPTADAELKSLGKQLDESYRRTANNLPTNSAVTIERDGRRDVLKLTPLDKLDEPPSLIDLRRDVATRLPRVDLTEVLMEVLAWTDFAAEIRHISEAEARVGDLDLSLCAVLLAEACNIGLEPLVRPDVPALTRGRLSWVQQNYVRAETITKANARLVDYRGKPFSLGWAFTGRKRSMKRAGSSYWWSLRVMATYSLSWLNGFMGTGEALASPGRHTTEWVHT